MRDMRTLRRFPLAAGLALAALVVHVAARAQPDAPACGTINADKLLRESKLAKAAQARLASEFDPRFAAIEPLSSVRNRAERAWFDAKDAKKPADEIAALKVAFDSARNAEKDAVQPIMKDLERRRNQELSALVARANELYRRIGSEQGLKLLFQDGESEPVFVFDAAMKASACRARLDLTAQVLEQLDRN
jgi:outer membrane protein